MSRKSLDQPSLQLVPSIESARAMWNIGAIAQWKSGHGPVSGGTLSALLVSSHSSFYLINFEYLLVCC